jgi:hypothetical protein
MKVSPCAGKPADPGFKLNVPMLLRLNMFHLLQAVSPNSIGLDIGVPARPVLVDTARWDFMDGRGARKSWPR